MNLRLIKKIAVFVFAVTSLLKLSAKDKRPNIVVVLCDDLGYNDVGFNGSKDILTPNLDKLANGGVKFTSAYVSHPFCGPSRTSLMTGQYAHVMGGQFNLLRNSDTADMGVPLEEKFISKELQESGYYTGAFGKWHLGTHKRFHPNKRGFDDFYGFLGGGHNYFPEQYREAYNRQVAAGNKNIFDYIKPLEYNGKEVKETEYITDALSREAVKFVTKASKKDQPFFMYLAYNAPHVPLQAKEEDEKVFASIKDKKRKTYAAMVYAVDRGVGKLVQELKRTNELNNTLIVFLSDNGGKLGKGASNYPLKEGKGSVYEGGHRVPMFMYWPNSLEKGKVYKHPVTGLDLYPTFAKLANKDFSINKKLSGKDVMCDVKKNQNTHKNDFIYIMRHRKGYSDVSVRQNEWKAVKAYQQSWQLYNVENDIEEQTNLAQDHPEILSKLVKSAEKWSTKHIQPRWFHSIEEGEQWREDEMPHFEQTFSLN